MTRTMISKSFFGVSEDDEFFNLPAAVAMYSRVSKMDADAASGFCAAMLFECVPADIRANAAEAQRGVDRLVAKRLADASRGLLRTYVSKRVDGEPIETVRKAAAAVAVIKDANDPPYNPPSERQYKRDQSGQFSTVESRVHHPINRVEAPHLKRKRAGMMGIPAMSEQDWKRLTPEQKTHFQQANLQLAHALRDARTHGMNARVTAHWSGPSGPQDITHVGGSIGIVDPKRIAEGNVLEGITVDKFTVDGTPIGTRSSGAAQMGGATYNLLSGMGHPGAAQVMAGQFEGGGLDPVRVKAHGADWNKQYDTPSSRFWARLGAGSSLLNDALGDRAPNSLRMATLAGKWAGEYGPEAQKVLGPAADKTAYRYRGTEKTPSPGLQSQVNSLRRTHDPDVAREKLIYGSIDAEGNHNPSNLMNYWRRRLPSQELSELQLKSGQVPPSQGVIINRAGKVTTEALGYGDDHYLPFNLKNLGSLKGGEYVRTRTQGGPTTEDVYTGLVGNARALSVVSHNGVYTMEFDDTFRGSRRYNDKAARMVTRYGQLLDAVASNQVTQRDIEPTRKEELRARAELFYPRAEDPTRYRTELKKLEDNERENPQLSQAAVLKAKTDFLDAYAERVKTADGSLMDWQGLASQQKAKEIRRFQDAAAAHGTIVSADDLNMAALDAKYDDPDRLAESLGLTERMTRAVKQADQANRDAMKPMALNGPGYLAALTALQEQFPYYIARVSYTPWADTNPRVPDRGYVVPGRNRPKAALAGYFDPTVGYGKISAQDTRFQRKEWQTEAPVDTVQARKKAEEEKAKTATAASTTSATTPTGTETPVALDAHDLLSVYDDLRKATPNPQGLASVKAALPTLHGKDRSEIENLAYSNPDELRRLLQVDYDKILANEKIEVKPPVEIGRRLKGFIKPERIRYDFDRAIEAPGTKFEFGIPTGLSSDKYNELLTADAKVQAGLQHLGVEPTEAAITAELTAIKDMWRARRDWDRTHIGAAPRAVTGELKVAYEGLLRYRAYNAAYSGAKTKEAAEQVAATRSSAERAAEAPELTIMNVHPDDLPEELRRRGLPPTLSP